LRNDPIDVSLNRLRCVELVGGVATGNSGKNWREGAVSRIRRPALATAADKVPKGTRWIREIKFDGYRVRL
jgi:ATP-dependent DNA ligase